VILGFSVDDNIVRYIFGPVYMLNDISDFFLKNFRGRGNTKVQSLILVDASVGIKYCDVSRLLIQI